MDNNKKITINRRQFNCGALTAGLFSVVPLVAYSKNKRTKPDGLIQLKRDGRIYLYSSGGHLGLYGDYVGYEKISAAAGCLKDELVVVQNEHQINLPSLLGQKINSMSYSEVETSLRAAKIMKRMRKRYEDIPRNVKTFIEDGVSNTTGNIIKTLEPQGIIIAVRG